MILSFDTGAMGGAACFYDDGTFWKWWQLRGKPMKYDDRTRNVVPITDIMDILQTVKLQRKSRVMGYNANEGMIVNVERPQLRGGNGAAIQTSGNFFAIYHAIVLSGLEPYYTAVHPNTWQSKLFADVKVGKKLNPNKQNSIAFAASVLASCGGLPTEKPNGKKMDDGVADAVCIGLWALMMKKETE